MELVLASASPYRGELMERLGLPFEQRAARIDERRHEGEASEAYVQRLAEEKARALIAPGRLTIGADQVGVTGQAPDDEILGKPADRADALRQLATLGGREVEFLTGLCLVGPDIAWIDCIATRVRFRPLAPARLEAYLAREEVLGCAAAFRSEGLGITLVEWIRGDDPTALIGLPLIRLGQWLERAGMPPLPP